MCDFKPGDEVVCYRHLTDAGVAEGMPPIGHVDVVRYVGRPKDGGPEVGILLEAHRIAGDLGFNAICFRKVQRRTDKLNLTEWLSRPSDFEEPKRTPAKKRERV